MLGCEVWGLLSVGVRVWGSRFVGVAMRGGNRVSGLQSVRVAKSGGC